ncbi:hypothetical protein Mgra_00008508, partial [Meloidogyne graminicola]
CVLLSRWFDGCIFGKFCQGKYSCYKPSNLGERHLTRKRHLINKKAFEDSSNKLNEDKNDNSVKFVIKCKDKDGCFIKSQQFKNTVYCNFCKRNLINKSSILNVHLQSNSHLNYKALYKEKNEADNPVKECIEINVNNGSSDEEALENSKVLENDQSFTRYLNLKKKYKNLQFCIYCNQHYKGSCVKEHVRRKKHKMLKKAFETKNKRKSNLNNKENEANNLENANKERSSKIPEALFDKTNENRESSTKTIKHKNIKYCVYCKRYYLSNSMRYHLKTYKHISLKKAFEECENNKENKQENKENKYDKMLASTGCFKRSSLGYSYAFCIYCQIDISFVRLINLEYHKKTTKHTLAKAAFEANLNNNEKIVSEGEDEIKKFNKIRKKSKKCKNNEAEKEDEKQHFESDSSLSLDEESEAAKIASILSQRRKGKVKV